MVVVLVVGLVLLIAAVTGPCAKHLVRDCGSRRYQRRAIEAFYTRDLNPGYCSLLDLALPLGASVKERGALRKWSREHILEW